MKKILILFLILFIVVSFASIAQAHMFWLNVSNYFPRQGEEVTIEIGFGHKYPKDEKIKEENIEQILVRDPNGHEVQLERIDIAKYRFTPKVEGQYEVIAKLKKGFVSNTPDGRKLGNRKTLNNVVSCFHFTMNAKTLINVGSKSKGCFYRSELPLEIVPVSNISKLKVGDELLLKVMYQGKPLKGVKFNAIDKNTALQEEGKWLQELESDVDGIVRIKLISKGPWLFTVSYELPYIDQAECDKSLYRTTLTFGLE